MLVILLLVGSVSYFVGQGIEIFQRLTAILETQGSDLKLILKFDKGVSKKLLIHRVTVPGLSLSGHKFPLEVPAEGGTFTFNARFRSSISFASSLMFLVSSKDRYRSCKVVKVKKIDATK